MKHKKIPKIHTCSVLSGKNQLLRIACPLRRTVSSLERFLCVNNFIPNLFGIIAESGLEVVLHETKLYIIMQQKSRTIKALFSRETNLFFPYYVLYYTS